MSDTIHRVNHEIRQRRLQVLRVTDLTPRMRRITLGGTELQGFTSVGSDDHIKLLFAETPEQHQAIEARNLGRDGGA
ncbi:siderophore-interacting protein, partial [Pseudomonas sp. SIMBA_065]